jgi:hypothetical protein
LPATSPRTGRLPVIVLCVFGALPAIACGAASTVDAGSLASPTTTATSAPATCAQINGFASAAAAAPVSGFNYGLPTNTVAPAAQTSAGASGQYTLYDVDLCTPNTTTELPIGATPRPLATALQVYGWGPMQVFPVGGDALQACPAGDTCYGYNVQTKNGVPFFAEPERFLALGSVQDRGNGLVTFHLKLAGPPAAAACTDPNLPNLEHTIYGASPVYLPYFGAPAHTSSDPYSGLQLPPVTRLYSESATGHTFYHICSAGTAASVSAFMYTQLTAEGWSGCSGQPAPTSSGGCFSFTYNQVCGANTVSTTQTLTLTVTDPATWGFSSVHPCFGQ